MRAHPAVSLKRVKGFIGFKNDGRCHHQRSHFQRQLVVVFGLQAVVTALDGFVLVASSDNGLMSTLTSNLFSFRRMMIGDSSNRALDECGSTSMLLSTLSLFVIAVHLRRRLRCLLTLPLPPLTLGGPPLLSLKRYGDQQLRRRACPEFVADQAMFLMLLE